ncbi:MAG TPA: globin domain-containing protein [Candidatus Saccharimonadia bacterium]|nr:globin domain-containing protein [Candidatus Saccharimonadia bacterium]
MLQLEQSTREAIRRSFAPVLARRDEFADAFYRRLFEYDPSLRAMFAHDLSETRRKFVDMLVVIVDAAAAYGPVRRIMEELGARHVAYGVQTEHYAVVVEILIETLRGSSDQFDAAAEDAWRALLAQVCEAMLFGAEQASAAAAGTYAATPPPH